jgi:hypothetical protein
MKYMLEMSQTEVAYWVAFLNDLNQRESGKMPKPGKPGKALR